jgi:NhaP-type Na+/H+ or K+/H+ antiporter
MHLVFDPYLTIAGICVIIIFSYIFLLIAKYTKIPSVLLLITTGVGLRYLSAVFGISLPDLFSPMNLLGIIGLMMIVLEGALDIEISKEKIWLILSSFFTAAITLGLIAFGIAYVLQMLLLEESFFKCLLYSIPLATVSSAIVIPSTQNLITNKKEFLIYESTFSDILGILFMDFAIVQYSSKAELAKAISLNVLFSLISSFIIAYILIFVFQKIKTKIKFFLFISILGLLFSIGKYFHFSSLLAILVFGIMLKNYRKFFAGWLKKLISSDDVIKSIHKEFHLITEETSFLIRTFFFIVFGMTINIQSMLSTELWIITAAILLVIYLIRLVNLMVFIRSGSIFPELFVSPRGLVTIILFYKIPEQYKIDGFNEGLLFSVIVATNIIMMFGLMIWGKNEINIKPRGESSLSEINY